MLRSILILTSLSISSVVCAHHSRANFDNSVVTELSGTVIDYSWRNPHVYMEVEVVEESGDHRTWLIESHSVTAMRRNGWSANTLNVGDQVTFSGSADKNPERPFLLLDYLQKNGGEKLYAFGNRDAAPIEKEIIPSTDFTGTWRLDFSRFDVKNAGGLPPEEWSYTELAQKSVDNFSFEQNPELECNAIGVPRIMIYPYGTNFTRDTNSIRIQKEHMDEKRTIWLDADAQGLEDQEPSYVGTSFGRFETDRHLIVETSGFLPTLWGTANGVDSSAKKSLVENYYLAEDGLSIEIAITVTDPVYLNEPVTLVGGYFKDENREFVETPCDPEAASRHLTVE